MKNILMVALNSSWSQSNLAFFYLREVIRHLPYAVDMRDFTLKDHLGDVLQSIYSTQADIICFSAYIWNCEYLQKLVPELKKLMPEAILVLGGPEAANRDYSLATRDFVVQGSGEGVFLELAENAFTVPAGNSSMALKDVPFPYRAEDISTIQGKLVYYESYRGCPYACVYCLSASDQRHELRFNPDCSSDMAKLDAELNALIALKPKTLKFIDRSFNIFPKLAHHIWQFFIKHESPCEVHFEIYPDLLCEADFSILKTAPPGVFRFEVGIQTTNDAIAKVSGRNSNWQKARQALLILKQRTEIRIHADLLAGLPGEDYASVLNSINGLCATLPDAVQLGTLKILPDTPMQEIATQRGYLWLNHPPYQCLASDALSFDEMCILESLAKLLNLYWNKEEYPHRWAQMLQKHQATDILFALLDMHKQLGYDLHSLAKGKREAVMEKLLLLTNTPA
ncbi:MAG: radical SAM protein [Candidatus Cloacimonetes bacterium HGW-Cloacimonetes-3]|jgi:radical SAM superfamily enzyme YgiQ (UPF0313 family)|nr:MAG: radical SAM protein [Candidatus Cloacimonetes bacterium HGW-Cloacimonetes-3]